MRLGTNQDASSKFRLTALLSLMVLCMLALSGRANGQGLGKIVGTVQDPSRRPLFAEGASLSTKG